MFGHAGCKSPPAYQKIEVTIKMRKKIAMRWRRQVLRRGAVILEERPVFTKRELFEEGLQKRDNAYEVRVKYKRNTYDVADDDMLKAYKLLSWCMDVEDEEDADPDGVHTIGGIWVGETGKADWIRE